MSDVEDGDRDGDGAPDGGGYDSGDDNMEEQVEKFYVELNVEQERQRRRFRTESTRAPRRKTTLPLHLREVMGSANLSLARGEVTASMELCMEAIRQVDPMSSYYMMKSITIMIISAPHAIEPFLTLANIYEDTGQKEKLHQILLIAANLKRTDVELWIKAGELSVELNQLPMAAQCLKKAYNLDKSNIPLLWRRATIHQELQEWNKAIKCYTTLKELLPADAGCDYIEMAKDMARIYHNLNETDSAIEVFKVASDKYFDFFDNEAINIYTELLISTRQFSDTFQLMARFYKINMQKISRDLPPIRTPLMDEPLTLSSALSMSLGATEDDISQAIAAFTGMSVVGGLDGDGDGPIESDLYEVNEIPEALPVDLRAKLIVSMIHLKYKFNKDILVILSSNPASYGDLMLDIAEAFMENANFSEALPLLSSLIETKEFNQAGVWLKHAECHHMLNELEAAALSYSNVLSLAPHHTETRMTLASLYSQLGMTEDALALLDAEDHLYNMMQQDEGQPCTGPDGSDAVDIDSSTRQSIVPSVGTSTTTTTTTTTTSNLLSHDVRLLQTKFSLLVSEDRTDEYIDVGMELLKFFFRHFYDRSDLKELFGYSKKGLRNKIKITTLPSKDDKLLNEQEALLTTNEWWSIFSKTCKALHKVGRRELVLHFIYCADVSKKLEPHRNELLLMGSYTCLVTGDDNLFDFMRMLYFRKSDFPLFWNLFNSIPPSNRQQKFVLRQVIKNPTNMSLIRISANYSLMNGSYKFALAQYEVAYRSDPNDYLLCLCIAVVYVHLLVQKNAQCRNTLALQSICFLYKYLKLRGPCQESYFNVGRLFHQLGLLHIACHYYKLVLSLEPEVPLNNLQDEENEQDVGDQVRDLRRAAAFNLSLIYRHSGNKQLALHYIRHYITI